MKQKLYIILCLVMSAVFVAQEPYAIQHNKSNGMPSNSVFNVFQDSKGFVWLASNAGLTRYDGFEYKTYTSHEQTSTPGSSIVEDKYGRIWYENFDGYLYYVKNDSMHALHQNKPIQYSPVTITHNYLFVFQKNGIDIYDLRTLKIIATKSIPIKKIEFSGSNLTGFYFIEGDIIYKINKEFKIVSTGFFEHKNIVLKQLYVNNHKIYAASKYNASKLIYVFDEELRHLYNIPIKEPEFIQGIDFTDSLIWVHTPQGTYTYRDNKFSPGLHQVFFKEKSISSVKKDRQLNYWFSTTNEGVFMVPNLNNMVYSQKNLLPNRIVSTKQGFIIATKKGELCLYDSLLSFKNIINKQVDNSEIYYLSYDSVTNDLFYSSKEFVYMPGSNHEKRTYYQPAIKEIVKIDEAFYAFAASGYCGLATFNSREINSSSWSKTYLNYPKTEVPNTASMIDGVRGKSVAYNKLKKTIYFATNVGLFKCSPTSVEEIKNNNTSFYASKIVFYNDVIYALSTKGDLYRIKKEHTFDLINHKKNINSSDVKLIKQYGETMVIITSNFAFMFNMETQQLTKIDISINAYEINDVLLSGNCLFFLTNAGIIKTAVAPFVIKKDAAALQLTEFAANGKTVSVDKEIELAYDQNDIAIRFSILDFGNLKENNVFYKVNDDDWKKISSETRLIEFASLKPGKYVIYFKINETVTPSTVQFTITTPFWQSIWFMLICFLVALTLGFTYYRWQLNKLLAKNKLLEDKNTLLQEKIELEHSLNKSVLKSIKAQMNPHFFYNALNTIQAYIFTNDKAKANSYLAKFSKLTRLILEQSEKETISLSDEIASLTLYLELEKMRFKEGFEYNIEQKTIAHKDSIEFPPMLIQPYVENAVKHGLLHKETDRKLFIVFEAINKDLVITIDDNGIGRKRSEELNKIKNDKYQSFSTQANEKRLGILNRTNTKIAVKIIDKIGINDQPMGTKVILTIPMT